MLKYSFFIGLILLISIHVNGQKEFGNEPGVVSRIMEKEVQRKGRIFFYWGYNRSGYSKSDFHISGEGYDLTYRKLTATDSPTPFSADNYITLNNISKPQYNYRLGFYLNNKLSISVGMDHMKYYMINEQTAKVEGYISPEASSKYAGTYDHIMQVDWRMLWFHHSDGLNFASVELEYNQPVWISPSKKFYLDVVGNVGVGLVIPKTYVMTLNEEVDNKFHIAGGGPSAKLGLRFTFWKNFYFEAATKGGYVWMPNILVNNEGSAKASQQFGWIQGFGALGISIPLSK